MGLGKITMALFS